MGNSHRFIGKPFNLRLFDGFDLMSSDGNGVNVSNKKACAILAYASLQQGSSISRERLAGLLWSNSSEEKARASLRQALKKLKLELSEAGFSGLFIERNEIRLQAGTLNVDVIDIFNSFSNAESSLTSVSNNQIPERVLYGFETLDQSFNTWLQMVRQNWHDSYVNALEQAFSSKNSINPKFAAETILKIDPSHERAHRFIISHHALQGNTALALRQYQTLWDLLDSDYDMEPDEETQALIVDVKLGKLSTKNGAAAADLDEPMQPVIASDQGSAAPVLEVWNFVQGGECKLEGYFIEGFRRELIASLVRFREWVISEGSVESSLEPAAIDAQTCDYRLEGSYLEHNDEVRLIITLKEVVTNRYIWSEQISLRVSDWVSAQQSIVRRISLAMGYNLSAERLTRADTGQIADTDLYDLWLRGQSLTMEWRPQAHKRAKEIFRTILDKEPGFGRAYSSLVQIENAASLLQPGLSRTPQTTQRNVDMARAAVAIDPLDTRAILHLGWALAVNRQFDQAEINLDLAGEANPNDHWTLVSVAAGLAFCGCNSKAQKLAEQVLSLSPAPTPTHWGYIGVVYFICNDFAKCISALRKANNVLIVLPAWAAAAHYHLGQFEEAAKSSQRFLDLVQEFSDARQPLAQSQISDWLLQCFPIKEKRTFDRFREGIVGAGIPVPASGTGNKNTVVHPQRANV